MGLQGPAGPSKFGVGVAGLVGAHDATCKPTQHECHAGPLRKDAPSLLVLKSASLSLHLCRNLAIGGLFPGPSDSTLKFPSTLTVDYVRVMGQ